MKRTLTTLAIAAALLGGPALAGVPEDIANAIKSFSGGDAKARLKAIDGLVKIGKPATAKLVDAIGSKSVAVQTCALNALGGILDPDAREKIAAVAADVKAPAPARVAAVEALARYADDKALAVLSKIAAEDVDQFVRIGATLAIASVRTKSSIDLLVWLLKCPDKEVKAVAARNLIEKTLKDFGTTYEPWQKWWMDSRDSFVITARVFPYSPLDKTLKAAKPAAGVEDEDADKPNDEDENEKEDAAEETE